MQPSKALGNLALASMLALSVVSVPAVHVRAAPNDGGGSGSSDTRPVGSECSFDGEYWICTTPEGGMWRCWDRNDRTACENINPSPQSPAGSRPVVIRPVIGGAFDPTFGSLTPAPQPPLRSVHPTP